MAIVDECIDSIEQKMAVARGESIHDVAVGHAYRRASALRERAIFRERYSALAVAAPRIVLSNMHHTVPPLFACAPMRNASPSRYDDVYDE